MTFHKVMRAAIFTFLSITLLSNTNEAATPPSAQTQSTETQPNQKWESPEEKLLKQLKNLLGPHGISVYRSALIDGNDVQSYWELTIKWKAHPDTSGEFVPDEKIKEKLIGKEMVVLKRKEHSGSIPQHYGLLQPMEGQIFVAAVDAGTQLRWWTLVQDPRVMRVESADSKGEISGRIIYRSSPEIFLYPPSVQEITELRFFLVKWSGSEFILEPLTVIHFKDLK